MTNKKEIENKDIEKNVKFDIEKSVPISFDLIS